MKIVVLAGGTSTERDVSIVSGYGVAKALRERGHEIILLDIFFGCTDEEAQKAFDNSQDFDAVAAYLKEKTKDVQEELKTRKEFFGPNVIELCKKADKVFMALHGANGEDGKVQAAFDLFGIKYSGCNYLGSAVAMDKGLTKIMFQHFGVSTPKGFVAARRKEDNSLGGNGLSLPVVVKPIDGGSSVGVYIVNSDEEYDKAIKESLAIEETVIVEEFIKGREFTSAVIGDQVYPVVEIIINEGFYDYENKYNGKTTEVCPAEISLEKTKEIQDMAKDAVKALGITGYSRMDFIMKEDGSLYCLEANTLPGMTPTSLVPQEAAAVGMSYGELCELLLSIEQ